MTKDYLNQLIYHAMCQPDEWDRWRCHRTIYAWHMAIQVTR